MRRTSFVVYGYGYFLGGSGRGRSMRDMAAAVKQGHHTVHVYLCVCSKTHQTYNERAPLGFSLFNLLSGRCMLCAEKHIVLL